MKIVKHIQLKKAVKQAEITEANISPTEFHSQALLQKSGGKGQKIEIEDGRWKLGDDISDKSIALNIDGK